MCPLAHEYYDVDHFVFVCYVCVLTFFFNLHFMWRLMKKKQQRRDNYRVTELNVRANTKATQFFTSSVYLHISSAIKTECFCIVLTEMWVL